MCEGLARSSRNFTCLLYALVIEIVLQCACDNRDATAVCAVRDATVNI